VLAFFVESQGGADTLQRWKIKLDPENEDVIIDKKATELKLI
jgi:hypothetical protein